MKEIKNFDLTTSDIKAVVDYNKKILKKEIYNKLDYKGNHEREVDTAIVYKRFIGGLNKGFFGMFQTDMKKDLNIEDVTSAMDAALLKYYNEMLEVLITNVKTGVFVFEGKVDETEAYYLAERVGLITKEEFSNDPDVFLSAKNKLEFPIAHLKKILKNSNKEINCFSIDIDVTDMYCLIEENFNEIISPKCVLTEEEKVEMLTNIRKNLNTSIVDLYNDKEKYSGPFISEMFKGFYSKTSKELAKFIKSNGVVIQNGALYDVLIKEQRDMLIVMHDTLLKLIKNYGDFRYKNNKNLLLLDAKLIGVVAREAYVDDPVKEIEDSIYINEKGKKKIDKEGYSRKRKY